MSRDWRGSLCQCWAEQNYAGPLPIGSYFQPWEIWCLLKQHSLCQPAPLPPTMQQSNAKAKGRARGVPCPHHTTA